MSNELTLQTEAKELAQQLFGNHNNKRCARFARSLLDMCAKAQDKDFLLIHNPGGWGSTPLQYCQEWERSIVEGVKSSIERLGYSSFVTQYFRGGRSWWAHLRESREQLRFFFKGKSAGTKVLAAELKFITRHLDSLRVILVGASQGAAFANTVMQQMDGFHRVYSIELGILFAHMSRRVITERTLAIDGNGLVPDPMAHRDLPEGLKAYGTAPLRWLKYLLQGKPRKFSNCINVPGHEYNWEYPEVHKTIEHFLETKFGAKKKVEVGLS
jgi:pimeloyl-ACP methyl ester carboxylesterase